jgi:branched-chain amino acid transport system ATP-binding protein
VIVAAELTKRFGAFAAVDGVSLALPAGARHALIGPNGAGKTTLINLLTGTLAPSAGSIRLAGADITALPTEARVKRGLARTFQINALFPALTALEAVTLAVAERLGLAGNFHGKLASCRDALAEALALLGALGLAEERHRPTRELAYGRQRLLEIALALATRPRVLLLDEPAAGVPRAESRAIFAALERLPADIAVLFIEHDMHLVFRFATLIHVMIGGRLVVAGSPAEIAADARVGEAYLGRRRYA